MQRGVEQTNRHGQVVHGFKNALEIFALDGQQFFERLAASGFVVGQYHLTHCFDAHAFKKHVLGTAKADATCAKIACYGSIVGRVGIGANQHIGIVIGHVHKFAKVAAKLGIDSFDASFVHFTGSTVERNPVAFFKIFPAGL